MDKKIKIVVGLVLVIIVLLGGIFWYSQNQPVEIKDCGVDTKCFAINFKACVPSKIYGGTIEIISGTPESCNMIFSSESPDKKERWTMDCIVRNSSSFNDAEMNSYSVYEKGSLCKGVLYDFFEKMPGATKRQ
ncbi:MAG: hypothetical protein WCK16_05140 [Candidatus Moraniibacteriota bacterium]